MENYKRKLVLVFGGILKGTERFENDYVDGILGMPNDSLPRNIICVEPLPDRLVSIGRVDNDIFSDGTACNAGLVTLGGSDPDYYDGYLQFVSINHGRGTINLL